MVDTPGGVATPSMQECGLLLLVNEGVLLPSSLREPGASAVLRQTEQVEKGSN